MKTLRPTFVMGLLSTLLSFFGCTNLPKENNVTINKLQEVLQNEGVVLLDVRTPKEIAQGKIQINALEADYFDAEFLEKVTSQLQKDKDVYVYCKSGRRSAKTVIKLRELGYTKTYNIEGGITAWKAAGYKVE